MVGYLIVDGIYSILLHRITEITIPNLQRKYDPPKRGTVSGISRRESPPPQFDTRYRPEYAWEGNLSYNSYRTINSAEVITDHGELF